MIAVFPVCAAIYNSLVLNTQQIFIASKEAIAVVSARGRPAVAGEKMLLVSVTRFASTWCTDGAKNLGSAPRAAVTLSSSCLRTPG